MQCLSCKTDNPPDAAFCEQCGSKVELVCPVCKTTVSPGARFCKKCGTAIAASIKKSTEPIRIADTTAPETLDGERKTVTALFADMKGSMELMEDLDPGLTAVLHARQTSSSFDPHCSQNAASGGLSVLQEGHCMGLGA